MGAAILLCRVTRSASLNSVDSQNSQILRPKGWACLGEIPQESWEIFHFATRADGVRAIWNTPLVPSSRHSADTRLSCCPTQALCRCCLSLWEGACQAVRIQRGPPRLRPGAGISSLSRPVNRWRGERSAARHSDWWARRRGRIRITLRGRPSGGGREDSRGPAEDGSEYKHKRSKAELWL